MAIEKKPFQSATKISIEVNPQTGQIAISNDKTATTPTTAPIGMSLGLNSQILLTPQKQGRTKVVYKMSKIIIVQAAMQISKNKGETLGFLNKLWKKFEQQMAPIATQIHTILFMYNKILSPRFSRSIIFLRSSVKGFFSKDDDSSFIRMFYDMLIVDILISVFYLL